MDDPRRDPGRRPDRGIADVFDAITSDRVYRPAMTLEQATAVLREGRGTHFDPVLLDHFLDDLAEAGVDAEPHGDRESLSFDFAERR